MENLPVDLRQPVRLNRLQVYAKPFKQIYTEFLVKKADLDYRCNFNGQIAYLETALNDRFDPINRGIYITEAFYNPVYIYLKSELKPAIKLYMKWDAVTSFGVGKFCFYQGSIYLANATALNKVPGVDPQWTLTLKKAPVIRMKENYNGVIGFYVNIPVAAYDPAQLAEIKSLINYYKLAGPGYLIKII